MAWTPIALIVPQYVDASGAPYSGAVLKAYSAGTTTNILMATNSGGGTTFTSIALNASGFPSHNGSILIPFISEAYKLVLYPTQAAADANTGAIWTQDNIQQIIISGSFSIDDAVSSGVTNVITVTHTTTGTPVAGIGTGIALVTETSSGNNETGMVIQAVATDVTPTAENFDFVLMLMRLGAAVATKLRVSSLGRLFGFTSLDLARATVASHATTGDIWSVGNQIDWTGTATTTAFPAAPQAGAERVLICAGACSFTAGANMLIDGVASASTVTCAANDTVIVRAVTTTQFKLSRIKYDGSAQVSAVSALSTSVDSEIALFSGTGGQTLKRATTGILEAASGVIGAAVSGTDLKTINSTSIIGSGDIATFPGAMILLATLTPTAAANVDFLTTFSSTYDNYLIVGDGILPASGSPNLDFRLAVAGTPVTTGSYTFVALGGTASATADTACTATVGGVASGQNGVNFNIWINNVNGSTYKRILSFALFQTSAGDNWADTSASTGFASGSVASGGRFYWSGGQNFAAVGKIRIYGIINT